LSERALLLTLALGNFVLGTGAFVLPALLQPLAADLGASLPAAGWLMSGYALTYAVASPVLTALTGRWPRRRVLLAGLVLIALGNALLAASPSLAVAHAGRVLSAVGGAFYTPIAASIAVAVAAPERRGRALALVFAGMTVAQVLGIPLGALAATGLGWRAVFAAVAVAAGATWLVVRARLPRDLAAPAANLGQLADLLRDPGAVVALSVTLLFFAGQFVVITFLGPVVTAAAGVGGTGLALLLWLFGLAAVAANLLGGAAADRFGPVPTIVGLTLVSAAVVAVLPGLQAQPVAAAACLVLWGLSGYAFMTPQQARLVGLLPWAPGLALSLNASALYAGSAAGGAIGGGIVAQAGLAYLGVGASALHAATLLLLAVSTRLRPAAGPPLRG
jgi:MFS transporter, DHA1 family, inner membrane transport protein